MHKTKKRFSDFAKEHRPLEGAKIRIDDVVNMEILIIAYKIKGSKYHKSLPCLTLQFVMGEERHILFTSSVVLAEQIEAYKDELPFYTTIKKIDRYYTFT